MINLKDALKIIKARRIAVQVDKTSDDSPYIYSVTYDWEMVDLDDDYPYELEPYLDYEVLDIRIVESSKSKIKLIVAEPVDEEDE